MERLKEETLRAVSRQMACHAWSQEELAELVAPRFGIISGFQDLLDSLDRLKEVDLGLLPPAAGIRPSCRPDD